MAAAHAARSVLLDTQRCGFSEPAANAATADADADAAKKLSAAAARACKGEE